MPTKIFQGVPGLGDLWLEREFYYYNEPILFTCVGQNGIRYLCSCCNLSSQWLLGELTLELLKGLIENKVTLCEAFQKKQGSLFPSKKKHRGFFYYR